MPASSAQSEQRFSVTWAFTSIKSGRAAHMQTNSCRRIRIGRFLWSDSLPVQECIAQPRAVSRAAHSLKTVHVHAPNIERSGIEKDQPVTTPHQPALRFLVFSKLVNALSICFIILYSGPLNMSSS